MVYRRIVAAFVTKFLFAFSLITWICIHSYFHLQNPFQTGLPLSITTKSIIHSDGIIHCFMEVCHSIPIWMNLVYLVYHIAIKLCDSVKARFYTSAINMLKFIWKLIIHLTSFHFVLCLIENWKLRSFDKNSTRGYRVNPLRQNNLNLDNRF